MNRIILRTLKMPITIRAFTMPDGDGDYNIYLNIDLSEEAKKKSFNHELKHILRNDFGKSLPAHLIEKDM